MCNNPAVGFLEGYSSVSSGRLQLTTSKVGVFPAAGKIGSSIYLNLFKLIPPEDFLLVSRSRRRYLPVWSRPAYKREKRTKTTLRHSSMLLMMHHA